MSSDLDAAITSLKQYVADQFDGSLASCFALDELLWEVRISHRHEPQMRPPEPTSPAPAPAPDPARRKPTLGDL